MCGVLKKIKVAFAESGMSQADLARGAGYSGAFLNQVLNGIRPPSPSLVERIASLLPGLNVEEILTELGQERISKRDGRSKGHGASVKSRDMRSEISSLSAIRAEGESAESHLPWVGGVPAGKRLEVEPTGESRPVPTRIASKGDCCATVTGDSMNLAHLLPGDLIVIKRQDHAELGKVVVVYIPGEGVTIKRLALMAGCPVLRPESSNPEHLAFPLTEEMRILGVVVWARTPDREF